MSDLLSSILGFLEAEFNWDMVLYLEKTKYLYQRNSFMVFLKNLKAKAPQAAIKKCLFHLTSMYVGMNSKWKGKIHSESFTFSRATDRKGKNPVLSDLGSSKD